MWRAAVVKRIVPKCSHASFSILKPSIDKDQLKRLKDEGFPEQTVAFLKDQVETAMRAATYEEYKYRISRFSINFLKVGAYSLVLSIGHTVWSAISLSDEKDK